MVLKLLYVTGINAHILLSRVLVISSFTNTLIERDQQILQKAPTLFQAYTDLLKGFLDLLDQEKSNLNRSTSPRIERNFSSHQIFRSIDYPGFARSRSLLK